MSVSLLIPLLGLALLDSLNPTLFVAQMYLMTTTRPVVRILSYIGGIFATNFAAGLLLLSGIRTLFVNFFSQLSPMFLHSGLLGLGIILISVGYLWKVKTGSMGDESKGWSLHPLHTFMLGIVIMANEVTTALPYFVAIERLVQASLDGPMNLVALAFYNVLFICPLLLFVALFLAYRDRFTAQLARVNQTIAHWLPRITKWLLIAFGLMLTFNSGSYLLVGQRVF
jgi:hypothetical protein